ncbi:MAG TPA: chemotaxis-specific protein-glutamate methyltransferase CheB [Candidatus Krumholzibacteria bacterium]|nr:chemotaxis-specific protein-glutamate methyltransferase CheB [Candidatus Krumholzibacteria bacterium]
MGIRALVIEDSIIFQRVMDSTLKGMRGIDGVSVAGTGREGLAAVDAGGVDVVFLDLNLPDMNGLAVLAELNRRPRRPEVIVVSAAGGSTTDVDLTVKALQSGALEFIRKPSSGGYLESVRMLREDLERAVKLMGTRRAFQAGVRPAIATPAVRPPQAATRPGGDSFWITAVAVSTGGPEALGKVVPDLPADYPVPVVVVQHMPPVFTRSLAASLDARSALTVVEAAEGMKLRAGTVYIAPGGRHMTVRREGGLDVVRLNDEAPECNVRPAADVLFRSLARIGDRASVLAVVMTGMGEDGKAGLTELKRGRCVCLSQSRESCVVYGMPRSVDEAGLADESVDLGRIARRLAELQKAPLAGRP